MSMNHRSYVLNPLRMVRYHHFTLIWALLFLQLVPSSSQNNLNWYCGESVADAALRCGVACPTGSGCPQGQYCFAGMDNCNTSSRYCGVDFNDANARCSEKCPSGKGCPFGQACFLNTNCNSVWAATDSTTSSSAGSSSSPATGTIKTFGHEAVEETFKSIKDIINDKLFLYETPDMQWLPSTVYRFDGFFEGLQLMYKQGVNGKKMYMGGNDPQCRHCHMYGLVNVAAFLAQAMKETVRYDACDENSWDRVGDLKMYPISNACGQLGQSYQDYHCKDEERYMECEVDVNMSIKAVTHAKWWGAPGPLFCGPKTQYPHTGYWDYSYECNNQWANPPESCDVYEGQKGGKHIDDAPYANAGGRTDVEGCCWWGRGVIQTSGVCNFGKLNYFLGKRAHDEGRESRYPEIDFCKDPEAICANDEYKELKWIAGFFYWVDQVQPYDEGGWNYLDELRKFVDDGMKGESFINSVSGIVNRGCHNPPCGTGALDGGPERAENFFKILKEMTFAWVDVDKTPPTLVPTQAPSPLPTENPSKEPTDPPFAIQIQWSSSLPSPEPITEAPTISPTTQPIETSSGSESSYIQYTCGDGIEAGAQTFTIIEFSYELHNGLDTTAGDALNEAKALYMDEVARRIGCSESFNRQLQQSDDDFNNIVGITSSKVDGLDQDVAGCTEDVSLDTQSTCSPAKGGFTLFAKPGTEQDTLNNISNGVKSIIKDSMTSGKYETGLILKTVYIGDRVETTPDSVYIYREPEPSKSTRNALIGLIVACAVLLCLLCLSLRSSRRRVREQLRREDEELAFEQYMSHYDKPYDGGRRRAANGYEADVYLHSQNQLPRNSNRRNLNHDDLTRQRKRGNAQGRRRGTDQSHHSRSSSDREVMANEFSRLPSNENYDYPDNRLPPPPPPPPRNKSTAINTARNNRTSSKARSVQSEDISSDESSSSSSSSSETLQESRGGATGSLGTNSASERQSSDSRLDEAAALAKEERRQRLEAAKARAASRRQARTIT